MKNNKTVLNISEINIELVKPQNGLIGFASFVLNNSIYMGGIGILRRLNDDSYRMVYPSRKVGEKNFNVYYPISKKAGARIEKAISDKLKDVLKNDRHNNTFNSCD